MVTTNVYSHDRQHVVIPQGSRILGEARRVDNFGQERVAVFFHRIIMPDGYSVSLDQFQGLNQVGETGLKDRVNNHYMKIFGASNGPWRDRGLQPPHEPRLHAIRHRSLGMQDARMPDTLRGGPDCADR
jgi:hypothetical protein